MAVIVIFYTLFYLLSCTFMLYHAVIFLVELHGISHDFTPCFISAPEPGHLRFDFEGECYLILM